MKIRRALAVVLAVTGLSMPGIAVASTVTPASQATTLWAGWATNKDNVSYTFVEASWKVPVVHCRDAKSLQAASFWVGLNGYGTSQVEQGGMSEECSHTTPYYFGWTVAYPLSKFTVIKNRIYPGDSMHAMAEFLPASSGPGTYKVYVTDDTRHWTHETTYRESAYASTAEVIVEAPGNGHGPLPLADFGKVTFTGILKDASGLNGHENQCLAGHDTLNLARRNPPNDAVASALKQSKNGTCTGTVTWKHG